MRIWPVFQVHLSLQTQKCHVHPCPAVSFSACAQPAKRVEAHLPGPSAQALVLHHFEGPNNQVSLELWMCVYWCVWEKGMVWQTWQQQTLNGLARFVWMTTAIASNEAREGWATALVHQNCLMKMRYTVNRGSRRDCKICMVSRNPWGWNPMKSFPCDPGSHLRRWATRPRIPSGGSSNASTRPFEPQVLGVFSVPDRMCPLIIPKALTKQH